MKRFKNLTNRQRVFRLNKLARANSRSVQRGGIFGDSDGWNILHIELDCGYDHHVNYDGSVVRDSQRDIIDLFLQERRA